MRRLVLALGIGAALPLLLAGCGAGFPFDTEEEAPAGYTKPQAMIVVATERNRYEQVYTDEVWDVTLEDGETFEGYLLGQVKVFLVNLNTMNQLADKKGVSLTGTEQSRLQSLAEKYYDGLTEADKSYIGANLEDVQSMYEEYYLANKAVGELIGGVDLEVSDSEAKAISVQMIQISSREAAEAVYRRVSQEGSDFLSIAKETSEGERTELLLGRGEMPQAVEDAAFALKSGEMSSLIEDGGWFYIIRCVNDYDVEATKQRKARIYEERKNQVFRQISSQLEVEGQTAFSDDFWDEIHFSKEDGTTTTDFFSLYQEEFGGQGV